MIDKRWVAVVSISLLAGLAGCGGSGKTTAPSASKTSQASQAEVQVERQLFAGIPGLVKQVSPSVVAIIVQTSNGTAEGSGVVWDKAGHIVTNNHVVEEVSKVDVHTAAGERINARIVATDPQTDLGVVKVDKGDLRPATFAVGLPDVGSLALAMGSPLGLENTVTAGIVSGLDRSLPTGGSEPSLVGLIQTDAAISPGNSGGALVGRDGRVMGINVAYLPPQQTGAVSIGFAIPAPTVRDVVPQLIDNGKVEHPYLGVQLSGGTAAGEPVVVAAVESGGPADDAGMRAGDVLVQVDGRDVTIIEDVYAALRDHKPGDVVRVELRRNGETRAVDVKLGERPAPAAGVLPSGGG